MEDIFKVIFYAVVVIIWIIYKANEQRKSGMWKKRTNQNPEPPKPQQETEIPELLKRFLEEKQPVKKAPVPVSRPPVKEGTAQVKPVSYYEPALKKPEGGPSVKSQIETDFPPPTGEAEETPFDFDLRKSIIAAEILKRPTW